MNEKEPGPLTSYNLEEFKELVKKTVEKREGTIELFRFFLLFSEEIERLNHEIFNLNTRLDCFEERL